MPGIAFAAAAAQRRVLARVLGKGLFPPRGGVEGVGGGLEAQQLQESQQPQPQQPQPAVRFVEGRPLLRLRLVAGSGGVDGGGSGGVDEGEAGWDWSSCLEEAEAPEEEEEAQQVQAALDALTPAVPTTPLLTEQPCLTATGPPPPACVATCSRRELLVCMLGTGCSVPSKHRAPAAIYLHAFERGGMLLDCGEGTHVTLWKCRPGGVPCSLPQPSGADPHRNGPTRLANSVQAAEPRTTRWEAASRREPRPKSPMLRRSSS